MLRFFGFLFLVLLAVGAWGYTQDWFKGYNKTDAQGKTRYGVEIDTEKMTNDFDAVSKWARQRLDDIDRQIADLRHQAAKANPNDKPAIEQEIRELEQKKGAATQSLQELEKEGDADKNESARRLQQELRDEEAKKSGGG